MADEITLSAKLRFASGLIDQSLEVAELLIDVDDIVYVKQAQSIPSSATSLDIGDCQPGGWLIIRNTDDTAYVDLIVQTGGGVNLEYGRLEPAEWACHRTSGTYATKLRSSSGDVIVEYLYVSGPTPV